MNRYTIPCTPKQTKKAFELGAPIEIKYEDRYTPTCIEQRSLIHINKYWCIIPTSEQMIGFLRSKGFRFQIDELSDTIVAYRVTFGTWYKNGQSSNPKGAIFAVIDFTLDFLSKIRK